MSSFSHALNRRRDGLSAGALAIAMVASLVMVGPGSSTAAQATATSQADVTARPDQTSAMLTARLEGHRVEITGDESESSTTYANPDGTLTSEQSDGPVRVEQPDGSYKPVDLDLDQDSDGSYTPAQSVAPVTFTGGDSTAAATLPEGSGRSFGLGWLSTLPAPTVSGGVATYKLSDTARLELSTTALGFDAHIVLTAPPTTAPTYQLPLRLAKLSVSQASNGTVNLTDSAGTNVASAHQFMMWDSSGGADPDPNAEVPVATTLDTSGATPKLDLAPAMSYLTAPTTVYPVTIDPDISSLSRHGDTYIDSSNPTTNYSSGYRTLLGSPDGSAERRVLLDFNPGALSGKDVTNMTLNLHQYYAATCTSKTDYAYPITESYSGATWSNQPNITTSTSYRGTLTGNKGASGCAGGNVTIDLTSMGEAWASGTWGSGDGGIELRASSETDANGEKRFCSMNADSGLSYCNDTSEEPTINVTYNSYPAVATHLTVAPSLTATNGLLVTTTHTPDLEASVADADGGHDRIDFQIDDSTESTTLWTGSASNVSAGAVGKVSVPSGTLATGYGYEWRARGEVTNGNGGTDYSPSWSAWQAFRVNTTPPIAATVSCSSFPSGQWTSGSPSNTPCTLTDGSDGDLAGFYYAFDNPDPETAAIASGTSATIHAPSGPASLPNGWHTLYVQTFDTAYNRAASITQYSFGVGVGGISSPDDGDTTQQAVTLTTSAASAETGVTYSYRIGTTGSWITVPTGDVTIPGTSTNPTWPQTVSGGSSAALDWNVAQTVTNAGGTDGPVQLEACFSHGATQDGCSTTETLTLSRTAFGSSQATTDFGPGTLALLTGDLDLNATDVDIASSGGDITVGRDLTTLSPTSTDTGATGIFGPAWTADLPAPNAGTSDEALVAAPGSGYATLTDPTGVISLYETTSTGYPYTYTGTGTANDGSILTQSSSTAANLLEADGTKTTWAKVGGLWQAQGVSEAAADDSTTYTYNSAGQVTQVLAPVPANVTCTTPLVTRGCRTLTLNYATASDTNLATGTSPSGWGDYWDSTNSVGRLSSISLTAYDPATSAMKTVAVADYTYDSTGMLRGEWDPRITPNLETMYTYNSAHRLSTITPPGLNGDTINYDNTSRVTSVQWTDPANGPVTESVAYGLPITGSGAPVDLSSTQTDSWGQTNDAAYTGTEVFQPDHVPAVGGNSDYAPTSSDFPYGSITYMDVNGQSVDEANYGAGAWQIASTQYDANGKIIWQLTPSNRAQALAPTADTDPLVANMATSAERADALATTNVYAANGYDLSDVYGPTHPVTLNNGALAGSIVDGQDHSHYIYNQGVPAGGDYDLLTEKDESPYFDQAGSSLPSDYTPDTRTTNTGYSPIDGSSDTGPTSGWTLGEPTTSTTVMPGGGSNNITSETEYDADGNTIQSRMPRATGGSDAETTDITYYGASANATYPECGNHPEWAGEACRSGLAAQPTSGPPLPVTELTYNMYDEPLVGTDTSGSITRVTTNTYDAAGRLLTTALNDGSAGVTQILTSTTGYDPSTGLPTTLSTSGATITTGYDALGRVTSYTVPVGSGTNTTTTTYDQDGRTVSIADGKGTTTYTYDGTDSLGRVEHRGLITKETTGVGTDAFTGSYDGDGTLTSETYPNGLIATTHYDNSGVADDLDYAMGTTVWADFTDVYNVFGEVSDQSSPESAQDIGYDNDGRINQVADSGDGTCVTRSYAYDHDSNRTTYTTYPADANNECSTGTAPSTENYGHDGADRLNDTGYTYDNLGRTLAVPAIDTYDSAPSPTALSLTYFSDDMVHTETQDGDTKTWTIDPAERLLGETDGATGITDTNVYSDSSDSPSWISSSSGSWSRNITDLAGSLAAVETGAIAADTTLELVNLHGDVVGTASDSGSASAPVPGTSSYFEDTEFGTPRADNPVVPNRYGWLGGLRRSSGDLGGLILMGARLYNPTSGRFLSVDPIPGGSSNPYDYAYQDPINHDDPAGTCGGCRRGGGGYTKVTISRLAKANGTNLKELIDHEMEDHPGRFSSRRAVRRALEKAASSKDAEIFMRDDGTIVIQDGAKGLRVYLNPDGGGGTIYQAKNFNKFNRENDERGTDGSRMTVGDAEGEGGAAGFVENFGGDRKHGDE